MTSGISIVGIGETPPIRRSGKNLRAMVIDAVLAALEDAGLSPRDVDGIMSDGAMMPVTVPHDYVAGQLGINRSYDSALSYGGAAIMAAPILAAQAIRDGLANVIVFYFGVDWGTLPTGPYGYHSLYPAKGAFEQPHGYSGQPAYFAMMAQRYRETYSLPREHLAQVAINQRNNALLNGNGQIKVPLSMDSYMSGRQIAEPLSLNDCCVITDGAGAYVMTSDARARSCAKPPVRILGAGYAAEPMTADDVFSQPDLTRFPAVEAALERALAKAGVKREDIDFAEIYDCFTISCLLQLEGLGFCGKGEAGAFVAEGNTALTGKLPVNTHGGFLSYSYRLGIEHLLEAVRQLRGEAGAAQVREASIGLVTGLSVPEYGALLLGKAQ
jgi:acetyl-CoA acetyltransferase